MVFNTSYTQLVLLPIWPSEGCMILRAHADLSAFKAIGVNYSSCGAILGC